MENLLNASESTSLIVPLMDDDDIINDLYYIVQKHNEAIKFGIHFYRWEFSFYGVHVWLCFRGVRLICYIRREYTLL